MLTAKKITGIALATAAAGLFATATVNTALAAKHEGSVKCEGINGCKGKSECATASHACAGQNSCKGKGWIKVSAKECKDKGGKVVESKKK
jgi:hypothetical protein